MVKWVKIFKTEKTIEIQLVRLTEVCSKVLSEKNAYKSVKVRLRWLGAVLQCSCTIVFSRLYIDILMAILDH